MASNFSAVHEPEASVESNRRPRESYKSKLKTLKKFAKDYVFLNAAVCDQVAETQEKLMIAKERRRFFYEKLLTMRARFETTNQLQTKPNQLLTVAQVVPSMELESVGQISHQETAVKTTKKHPKLKKSHSKSKKVSVEEEFSDEHNADQPVFPMKLGDLTVHSLGTLLPDQAENYSENLKVRVGFFSTRIYAHLDSPDTMCLYNCKVLTGENGLLRFQISGDVMEHPIEADSATECHLQLIGHINNTLGTEAITVHAARGPDFFGFAHPSVQRLTSPADEYLATSADAQYEDDASLCFDALQRCVTFARMQAGGETGGEEFEEVLEEAIEDYGSWM